MLDDIFPIGIIKISVPNENLLYFYRSFNQNHGEILNIRKRCTKINKILLRKMSKMI